MYRIYIYIFKIFWHFVLARTHGSENTCVQFVR